MTAKHVEVLRAIRRGTYPDGTSRQHEEALDAAIAALDAGAVGDVNELAERLWERMQTSKWASEIDALTEALQEELPSLAHPQRQGQAVAIESAENDPMRTHFTCERMDNAGGTPGFTIYATKMGAHGIFQLYRNEAESLWLNLGKALGLYTEPPASQGQVSGWPAYEAFEQFLAAEINTAPEPMRRLGEWLSRVLDEDDVKTAHGLLLGAMLAASAKDREGADHDICDAVMDPNGICPECKQPLHVTQPASQGQASAETALTAAGVFKGAHGLRGLAESQAFWDGQPYNTRLYYGDGGGDYLHRDVLRAVVRLLDTQPASAAVADGWKLVPIEPTEEMLQGMDKGSAYSTWKNFLAAAPEVPHG